MIRAADLFCGAGGTSTGLALACRELSRPVDLVAINHWRPAVETHKANHPWARHIPERLESEEAQPRVAVPGGKLDVLAASPECTHHSVARGGKPISDQSRETAWSVIKWCDALRVESLLVENVPEFQTWGPIGANGRPLKSRRGETFNAWIAALRSLGFYVDHRVLNAADYGDATTRRRLFVLASRKRAGIRWPDPSHAKDAGSDLFGGRERWRAAREIIDGRVPTQSIFNRKRPLSLKTLARIEHGIRRYWGKWAEPFLVLLRGGGNRGAGGVRDVDLPLPALTSGGGHVAVAQFILCNRNNNVPTSIDEPIKPLCAGGQHMAHVEGFLATLAHSGDEGRVRDLGQPMPTQSAHNQFAVVDAMLIPQGGGGNARPLDEPAPTVACAGAIQIAEGLLIPRHNERDGEAPRVHRDSEPMPTLTAENNPMFCDALILPYYGATRGCQSSEEPLPTCTTKERFALVTIGGTQYALDIRLRMLQPHELAAAMGFPVDYRFMAPKFKRQRISGTRKFEKVFVGVGPATKTEAVRMIGNAVAVNQSKALFGALLR